MAGSQLILVAVRLVGVLVGLHALVAAGEWITRYPSTAWHPWAWWICLLIAAWALVSFFMVVWPKHAARMISPVRRHSAQVFDRDTVEGIGLRLVGVYILVQAVAETTHIALYHVVFQLYLRGLWLIWANASPDGIVSVASASVKTVAGAYLIVGAHQVQAAIQWIRTAGRNWEPDDAKDND
jgi:hypothetical protein